MSVNIVNLFDAARRHRDWTNRELGEFYRVESMLARAGLDVETDRGLTDEGDPWFVFCHAVTGDVIAHLARYDGFYVIASAMLENSIRGRDFRALIETMLRTYTVALPAKDEAGVKVSIHPSALLVSLIMICFFKLSVTQSDAFEATTLNPPDHLASDPDFNGVDASAMDEHHSRAFIAAIAFAVGWSYAVGADNQTPAVELGSFFGTEQSQEHSGAAITISGELSGTAPSDALRDHSGSPSMAIVDANDANPDLLVNPAVVAQ